MEATEPSTEDDGAWKVRFLESVDELERKEAEYKEMEDLLRRSVSRLAVAGFGHDGSLNTDLAALRQSLRNQGDARQIAALVVRITDAATRLKDATNEARNHPTLTLTEMLVHLDLPAPVAEEVRTLRQQLVSGVTPPASVETLERVATILQSVLFAGGQPRATVPGNAGRRAGLLHRLRTTLAIAGGTAPAAAAPGSSSRLIQALAALVDRFDLPASLRERRKAILKELKRHRDDASLGPVLTDIADLVAAMCQNLTRQSNELERFLFGVNNRLRQIEQHVTDADDTRRKISDSGQNLENHMRKGMASMRDSLAGAADLDAVKGAIVSGLDTVERQLDDYRVRESELGMAAEAHIAELRGKLEAMEQEGDILRQRLHREQEKSLRDALTGIYNRLAHEEHMAKAFAHWKRYGSPLSVIMIDIDDFKVLNDTYGHPAGDKVLKAVARHLGKQVRDSDILARYGGEEFAVILPETDCPAAQGVAEKLRSQVERFGFRHKGEPVRVTVSCGVTAFRYEDTPETAVERADKLMYQAKSEGRNRCVGDC